MINSIHQRNFILGGNWIYYKIYTGPKTTEKILLDTIRPAVKQLKNDNVIDKWFFIRYKDPEHHIRVRFHLINVAHISKIIECLYPQLKYYLTHHLIWKIQIDTYNREVERYGLYTMELSESLFCHDSNMITDFLSFINEKESSHELRWLFSLKAIDSFLTCFNFTLQDKNSLLSTLSNNFRNEFDSSNFLKKQLSNKYRLNRKKIETFMDDGEEMLQFLIDEKEKNIKNIVSDIMTFKIEKKMKVDFDYFLGSHIHMLMNRLFKSRNRINEMVCYDFLNQYYNSKIARELSLAKSNK